jgi:hypothetical protein
MKRPWTLAVALFVLSAFVCLVVWFALYPNRSDPKSLQYVLWKRGLYPLDPDVALGTMIGDAGRDNLVVGKSKDQLEARFGFLTPIGSASQYDQRAYQSLPIKAANREVFALRRSTWLVVFSEGKASELILIKGN